MEVRIETFDDIEVARIRHVGPYDEIGPCFERLLEWAATIGVEPGRVLSLSYPMTPKMSRRRAYAPTHASSFIPTPRLPSASRSTSSGVDGTPFTPIAVPMTVLPKPISGCSDCGCRRAAKRWTTDHAWRFVTTRR